MKQTSHFVVGKRTIQLMVGVIICLAFVWQVVIPFLRTSASAPVLTSHSQEVSFFNHDDNTFPLFPYPSPPEVPATDEIETNDETNDELSSFFANLRGEDHDILFAENQLLSLLQASLENRSSVSLVVLYHCWKSSLA